MSTKNFAYVVFTSNGESYEDEVRFNTGVFSSIESAVNHIQTNQAIPFLSLWCEIQIWDMSTGHKVHMIHLEKNFNSEKNLVWQIWYLGEWRNPADINLKNLLKLPS